MATTDPANKGPQRKTGSGDPNKGRHRNTTSEDPIESFLKQFGTATFIPDGQHRMASLRDIIKAKRQLAEANVPGQKRGRG